MPRSRTRPTFAELLTIREAASYLGVSPNTLRAWDHSGKFPARRHPLNQYRLYDRISLDKLLRTLHGPRPSSGASR